MVEVMILIFHFLLNIDLLFVLFIDHLRFWLEVFFPLFLIFKNVIFVFRPLSPRLLPSFRFFLAFFLVFSALPVQHFWRSLVYIFLDLLQCYDGNVEVFFGNFLVQLQPGHQNVRPPFVRLHFVFDIVEDNGSGGRPEIVILNCGGDVAALVCGFGEDGRGVGNQIDQLIGYGFGCLPEWSRFELEAIFGTSWLQDALWEAEVGPLCFFQNFDGSLSGVSMIEKIVAEILGTDEEPEARGG